MSFKSDAAEHQNHYFLSSEKQSPKRLIGRARNHWLNESAAKAGKNFYDGYCIFEGLTESRGNETNTPEWFKDTLRSQHIPYNFFIPLKREEELAIKVLNKLFELKITNITDVQIEYPSQKTNPLNDRTSFDAFVSYLAGETKGFLGIEVKYTEGGYSPTAKERKLFKDDEQSIYYQNTDEELYVDTKNQSLKKNRYRQIWRNHLLASEFKKQEYYDQFTSVTIYPEGNDHFEKAISKFRKFLTDEGKQTLQGITYENFFAALLEFAETDKQRNWISYLTTRYLVK